MQLYRAFTFHWIHGSILHLGVNLLGLAGAFGHLERAISTKPFVSLLLRLMVGQAGIMLAAFAAVPRFGICPLPPQASQHAARFRLSRFRLSRRRLAIIFSNARVRSMFESSMFQSLCLARTPAARCSPRQRRTRRRPSRRDLVV